MVIEVAVVVMIPLPEVMKVKLAGGYGGYILCDVCVCVCDV